MGTTAMSACYQAGGARLPDASLPLGIYVESGGVGAFNGAAYHFEKDGAYISYDYEGADHNGDNGPCTGRVTIAIAHMGSKK